MERDTRFTVVGAGHGGKAMAAHLALMGYPVTLYNRTAAHIAAIAARGGIQLTSVDPADPQGFGSLHAVTSSMEEALHEADIVMVVVPACAHCDVARLAAPYLQDGQVVILNPGRTCGAIEFAHTLREEGCKARIDLAETATFIFASRSDGPAQARISRIKDAVPLAALPAMRTPHVLEVLRPAYPHFIDGLNVLHTSLNNMGAIFHPALTLLNAGRIESTHGDYQFYVDGVTPAVARVLEALDRERVTVAAALGIRAITAQEWLQMAYDARGSRLDDAIHNNPGYYGIKAPASLEHRYIFEDVPMSLVPIAALGAQYGVQTRAVEAIVRLACIVHQTVYWRRGRTLRTLGLEGLSVSELTAYVMEGVEP
ncbi:MAG: NAD/NADP octopine/nopaline dehydrogenase family protein [Anaerolineae bacterium]